MNVQKIFEALEEDSQNSGLGIICAEIEAQGYSVTIDGIPVTSAGFFENQFLELENRLGLLNVALHKNDEFVQEFGIEFIDFHDIIIKKAVRS